jgi:hypothetical protein
MSRSSLLKKSDAITYPARTNDANSTTRRM